MKFLLRSFFSSRFPTAWISVKRCIEYFFNGPTAFESVEDHVPSPAFLFSPSGYALSFATEREKCVVSSISSVLLTCCPSDVARLISLLRVYAVQLKPLSRVIANGSAYIAGEDGVVRPVWMHGYPTPPVVAVGIMRRAVATSARAYPTGVERSSNFAVVGAHPSFSRHQCKEALQL